jgi:hypothetical protein
LGKIGRNWAKLDTIGQYWAKLGKIGQNWAKLNKFLFNIIYYRGILFMPVGYNFLPNSAMLCTDFHLICPQFVWWVGKGVFLSRKHPIGCFLFNFDDAKWPKFVKTFHHRIAVTK